jgi:hypothetical protein
MDSAQSVVVFDTIFNFVSDLSQLYGKRQYSLLLYNRLLTKTPVSNKDAILKNVELFKNFCVQNRAAILDMKYEAMESKKIIYSPKVFIDFEHIFKVADQDSKRAIWAHLLKISAFTDPDANAKQVLVKMCDKKTTTPLADGDSKEENFLNNIFQTVEKTLENGTVDTQNPMSIVSNMLSSGVLNDLMGNMKNGLEKGDLDLGKLMGAVQGVMTKIGGPNGGAAMPPGMPDLGAMMAAMNLPQK